MKKYSYVFTLKGKRIDTRKREECVIFWDRIHKWNEMRKAKKKKEMRKIT